MSMKAGDVLTKPLLENNAIMIQVLGICSSLAVTVQLKPAMVMGISLAVVTGVSNLAVSLVRKVIPGKIRIIAYMIIASVLVSLADQFLRAYVYDVSKQLSVFVGLIITNCILMGRQEAFANSNGPWLSFLDGIGNGAGYAMVLITIASIREVLGSGKLLGVELVPKMIYEYTPYANNGLMLLAPGAFFIIGVLIWLTNTYKAASNKK